MAYEPSEPKWPWREFLTAEESAVIAETDALLAESKETGRVATARRLHIVNRAIQRAKYAAQKQEKANGEIPKQEGRSRP